MKTEIVASNRMKCRKSSHGAQKINNSFPKGDTMRERLAQVEIEQNVSIEDGWKLTEIKPRLF